MAPNRDPLALMFHSKKKGGSASNISPTKRSPLPSNANSPQPQPPSQAPPQAQPQTQAKKSPFPSGPYQEWTVLSGSQEVWDYDVMKFEHRKKVEVEKWAQPVKLNRRELRRNDKDDGAELPQAVAPMLGQDGKPVVGMDGRVVMVDAEGRPIHNNTAGRGGARGRGGRKFQKKTRQVFLVPEETRRLRKEERYPWVIEDATGSETWTASMEEVTLSATHAMLLPAENDQPYFFFNPLHRWYKFQRKPNHEVPNLEQAEDLMTKIQKNKEPARWLLRKRGEKNIKEADVARFKSELGGDAGDSSLAGGSLGPGGRRLRAVNSGGDDGLFGDDDDEEAVRRRRQRELGRHGDLDEVDFNDEFADDDQTMEVDEKEDEESKEIEARLQREFDAANKAREGEEAEDEENDLELQLSGDGKRLKKIMKKHRTDSDEEGSDEEGNPYASSEEEEEEEPPATQTGPAIQQQQQPQPSQSSNDAKSTPPPPVPANGSQPSTPRATSPAASTMGGHSIVAKRATSPKLTRPKPSAGSRATSPLAGGLSSRATSPAASRSGSPPVASTSNKRKADDGTAPVPRPKKVKPSQESTLPEPSLAEIVEWFEKHGEASTKDCSTAFRPRLPNDEKRKEFIRKIKTICASRDNLLHLRPTARKIAGMPPAS